ncbi:MAG: T9SS type A sorting domain-containing protein [Bacteroidota bacterium]
MVTDACGTIVESSIGTITAPAPIVVALTSASIKGVCKVTAIATGGTPFPSNQQYNFSWQTSPNFYVTPVNSGGSSTISVPAGTSVTVTVVDSKQCVKQNNTTSCPNPKMLNNDNADSSENDQEHLPNGNISNNENVIIYPNPTNEKINIDFSYSEKLVGNISLYNSIGKIVRVIKDGVIEKEIHNIDISEFANGVYYIAIRTDKWTKTERLVIQK